MNTIELKNIIKLQIDFINDKKLLEALFTLISSKSDNLILLSDEQKKLIEKARKEYSEGNFYDNNQVNEEFEKWLKEE